MTEYILNPDVQALTTALAAAQAAHEAPDWEEIAGHLIEQLDELQKANQLLQQDLAVAREINANQERVIDALRRKDAIRNNNL